MHIVRIDAIKRIIEKLTVLKTQIELENGVHLFDNNIGLEDLVKCIFNFQLARVNSSLIEITSAHIYCR